MNANILKKYLSIITVIIFLVLSFFFVAGTAVLTAEGTKNIEDVEVGDLVYAYNEETGETGLKPVVRTFISLADELSIVRTSDGQTIASTIGHPYYTENRDWLRAEDLRAGDLLLTVNGQLVIVEFVQHELLEIPVFVYNFEVRDYHTYYVSQGINSDMCAFVVVHNKCDAIGNSHGNVDHRAKIDEMVGKLEKGPNVKEVYVNKSLKTAGMNGSQRPDIIVKMNNGKSVIIEVASPSQLTGVRQVALAKKVVSMAEVNGAIWRLF